MSRIGDRVPGFGGVCLDSDQNIVHIYLQDASVQKDAERVVSEVLGPDLLTASDPRQSFWPPVASPEDVTELFAASN